VCIIIDANTIPSVFDSKSKEHASFVPVLTWITTGKGRIIYGGSKYRSELGRLPVYLRLIANLERQGRVIILPNSPVDRYAAKLKIKVPAKKFDDEHIVAIVAVSGCRVVCTSDKTAHIYLRRRDLYPSGVKRPKIYSAARHVNLCRDQNIAEICQGRQIR